MADGPSREEFKAFCDRIYDTQDAGFQGVHDRLDLLNGRIGKGEVAFAALDARTTNLEKEVFSRPQRRQEDLPAEPGFTKREAALAAIGTAAIAGVWKLVILLGTAVVELGKAALKHP